MNSRVPFVVRLLSGTFRRGSLALATLAGVAFSVGGRNVHAQADAGPMVLRIAAGTRALALGNVGLTSNDADALFYNPALLFNARGMSASMQRFSSFATAGSLANIVTLGSTNVGVGVQYLEYSALPLSYRELTRLGATALSDSGGIPATSLAFTVGMTRTIKGKRIGISAKFLSDRFGAVDDGTVAFDAGLIGPAVAQGTIVFVAQNIGAGLRLAGAEGKLPTRVGAGWSRSASWETLDLGLHTQLTVDRDGFVRPAAGGEFGYVPIDGVSFVARVGARMPRETDESFATGGLGINVDRFSLDYALEPFMGGRGVSHRLGIRIK